jgi:hypothetical protein
MMSNGGDTTTTNYLDLCAATNDLRPPLPVP